MTAAALFTAVVVAAMVVVMALEIVAPSMAVMTGMIVLLVSGVVEADAALAGFSNPAPFTVAALFVLARAVEKTGVLQPVVSSALSVASGTRGNLFRILVPTAAASALLNNTPVVAMLVPQVTAWSRRHGRAAAFFLMPISFAAILGGMMTLVGTSTNLIVSGLLEEAGREPLGMFEVSGVGGPVALAGLLIVIFFAPRILEGRPGPLEAFDSSFREYAVEMEVQSGGPLEGVSVEGAGLRHLRSVFPVRIRRGDDVVAPVAPDMLLQGGDVLAFVGRADQVVDLQAIRGLRSAEHEHADGFRDARHGFFEVVISPVSPLAGRTLAESEFGEQYGAVVLAIHRAGTNVREKLGSVPLKTGDTLLILSDQGFRDRWRDRRDFLLVADLDGALPSRSRRGPLVLATAVAIVVLAALGVVPILHGSLVAAAMMVVTRTLTPIEARHAVNIEVLLVIAGAFGVGAAVEESGLADTLASGLVVSGTVMGAAGALAAVVVATLVLTELITNNAAAVLMFPVATAVAESLGGEVRVFAIAVALAASASFLTPIGYQTNTMVYGPGGYRFLDYARLGWPVTLAVVVLITLLLTVGAA